MISQKITVDLGERSYDVTIGPAALSDAGAAVAALGAPTSVAVISDATVAELYAPKVLAALEAAGLRATLIAFGPGEQHKTLATYGRVMDSLLAIDPPIDRKAVVVALGGGVPGDLAGFVAATALRGLRWMQCPTTLLADVDASVGGKTAVDHPSGKNLIGAFHQPSAVLIDVDTLKTLGDDELRNGLAECVKHGVIRDETLLRFIEDNAESIFRRDSEVLTDLIARNVRIKAAVVAADERESDQRAHLNFGHTVGHAIEACIGYREMPHGRAVSLGMLVECRMAVQRGALGPDAEARVRRLLSRLDLDVTRGPLKPEEIWQIMQHDKKVLAGRVRMSLPTALGEVRIFDDITDKAVRDALEAITPGT